jgi:ethanolaminephosphotransferase
VDYNVTRHINTDLRENDWDTVILHYLGLDHIGHLGGPDSLLMKPKQKEMDQAIESIYNIVAEQDAKRIMGDPKAKGTLIVVCGDHGMNEVRYINFGI